MLRMTPMMTFGSRRRDASVAERCWTCWKLPTNKLNVRGVFHIPVAHKRLRKSSMLWMTAHESRTMKHMVRKATFFHRELGIRAGFPSFSCLPSQSMKAGIIATATINNEMFVGLRMLEMLPVSVLQRR